MPIIADYNSEGLTVKNAYIRIHRIWGSKEEGWNGWVAVREAKDLAILTQFHICCPYVEDENPYPALYHAVLAVSMLKKKEAVVEPSVDVKIETETEFVVLEQLAEPPKKKGRKKNSA